MYKNEDKSYEINVVQLVFEERAISNQSFLIISNID